MITRIYGEPDGGNTFQCIAWEEPTLYFGIQCAGMEDPVIYCDLPEGMI